MAEDLRDRWLGLTKPELVHPDFRAIRRITEFGTLRLGIRHGWVVVVSHVISVDVRMPDGDCQSLAENTLSMKFEDDADVPRDYVKSINGTPVVFFTRLDVEHTGACRITYHDKAFRYC